MNNGHDDQGRFAPGNPGGPARPRRAVEREYLAKLGDAVTLHDWRDVVARAVAATKKSDHQARAWLAKHSIGEKPSSLLDLTPAELRGRTVDHEVCDMAVRQDQDAKQQSQFDAILGRLK